MRATTGKTVTITGQGLPEMLTDLEQFCQAHNLIMTIENGLGNSRRSRLDIPCPGLLDAYQRLKSVRATARELGIPPGTAWNRLKGAGAFGKKDKRD